MNSSSLNRMAVICIFASGSWAFGQEVILPEGRRVYHVSEAIPVTVSGVKPSEPVSLELVSAGKTSATPFQGNMPGEGATRSAKIPAGSLAPDTYQLKMNGTDAGEITIVAGVPTSSMLLAQTSLPSPQGGGNFNVGNAFSFGLLDAEGGPLIDVRNQQSQGIAGLEKMMKSGLPAICYMYWTGYVTHKPFGSVRFQDIGNVLYSGHG